MTIFPEICQEGFVPEPTRTIPEKGNKVRSYTRRTKQQRQMLVACARLTRDPKRITS